MAVPVWYLNHKTNLNGAQGRVVLVDPVSGPEADVGRLLERKSFGKTSWKHHLIRNYLADLSTKLIASRQRVLYACRRVDAGQRADMEAGMAKLFASETAMQIALDAIRIHGGYGYSREFDVARYFRDAPLMIVGEGTNKIQRNIMVRQRVSRGTVAP